ncbi:sensor domain-containing protein [Rhodococcus oryzae]|uniref:sensor histidine kinase n=1 Tax=Rhodococcus oryzae TaxID=2571143 RepID=UPI0037A12A8A
MTAPGSLPIRRNPLRAWLSVDWWLAVLSLLSAALSGIVGLLLITLLAAAALTLPMALLGVLVFACTIPAVRAADAAQRAAVRFLGGGRIAEPDRPGGPTRRARFVAAARDPALWRSLAYWFLRIPLGVLLPIVVAALFTAPLTLTLAPVAWLLTDPGDSELREHFVGLPSLLAVGAVGAVGAVWLMLLTPLLVSALARADWWCTRMLLGASTTQERVAQLTESRARVIDAAEADRRRIERDLHDGAQQRLVSVSISLGQARSRVTASEDETLRTLLDDAHRETKNAIGEIRALTRGLHPPILTDRGLDAALSSVATLCAVPVDIDVAAELAGVGRPSAALESNIYFLVSEALTNVSKHANATRAAVAVERVGSAIRVTVDDDGDGGARILPSGGLAGLADRLSGVDGTLRVESPAGGPTRLLVEVPCG